MNRPRNLPRTALICLALGLITFAVFWPSLSHDFLSYDDQQYVTENAHVQAGLTWPAVVWAFKSTYASNWHPLTWLSHMLDCQLYGPRPFGHHLTSVLLHVANTLLLFLVLHRMTGAAWRSAFVAALFAWHLLHVESVAWVAERKDLLSAFFWLLTLWAYVKYVKSGESSARGPDPTLHDSRRHPLWYLLGLFFFALGLMAKPMVVTLPFLLVLLDFWPLRRLELPLRSYRSPLLLVLEKIPFLALSALDCAVTISAQRQAYSIVSTAGLPVSQRLGHALVAYMHYLGAMLVPRDLAVCYPYQTAVAPAEIILAGGGVALITLLAVRFATRWPYLIVGWLWYVGMLVPVIGLVQVGDQAWADRYTYLPLIGPFITIVWAAAEVAGRSIATMKTTLILQVLRALPIAVGLALLIGTSRQLRYWQNTRTLFEHAAQVTRNNGRAIAVLGSLLAQEGKLEEAMALYAQALRYKPYDPEAHFFLGNALEQQGKLDQAIAEYSQALWFKPLQEKTHLFLGAAFAKQNNYDEALAHYGAVLAINPESSIAHNNLAKILHLQGRLDEAIEHYSAALKMEPRLAQAHNNLGVVLLQKGRLAEGVAQLREALQLRPDDAESQYNLALALNQQENWKEAAEIFSRIAPSRPDDAKLHCEFGLALAHLQRTREAMSHYAHALLLQPDFPEALDRLSWILATDPHGEFRNGTEAVRMAERACELTGRKQPLLLLTLAAAYAEAGRFPEAVATAQKAQDFAAKSSQKDLALKCLSMLETFRSVNPWREPSR